MVVVMSVVSHEAYLTTNLTNFTNGVGRVSVEDFSRASRAFQNLVRVVREVRGSTFQNVSTILPKWSPAAMASNAARASVKG